MSIIFATLLCLNPAAADPPQEVETGTIETATEAGAEKETTTNPVDALFDTLAREGIGGLRKLWKETGVSSGLFADLADDASLIIARFTADLDGSGDEEPLLRITDSNENDYQFLALRHNGESWTALGHVDLWNQRLAAPTHRMATLDADHRWLVIRSLKGSGSGFAHHQESWYEVEGGGALNPVLSYPVEGHVSGHGMPFDRTFRGEHLGVSQGEGEGSAVVDVDVSARYTNGDVYEIEGLDELFTRQASLHYVCKSDTDQFSLDEERSGMSEAEIIGIYADDEEGFLQHNFAQLREIAAGSDELRKKWLRMFLKDREESSEKTILQNLLDPQSASTADAGD